MRLYPTFQPFNLFPNITIFVTSMSEKVIKNPERHLKVYIVRHGQTNENINRIIQGHLDTQLNSDGQSQAIALGKCLGTDGIHFDAVYASDLKRVKTTTNLVLSQMGHIGSASFDLKKGVLKDMGSSDQAYNIPVTYTPNLRERYLGELESMHYKAACQKAKQEGKMFNDYGEPVPDFQLRLRGSWSQIIADAASHPSWTSVLVVSHGGVIARLCAELVNSRAIKIDKAVSLKSIVVPPNTSVTELDIPLGETAKKGRLLVFGSIDHLKKPVKTFQFEK